MQLPHLRIHLFVLLLSVLRTVAVYQYKEDVALEAIRYASAAYCDADRLTSWDCESCVKFPNMKVLNVFQSGKTGGYAFLGIDESTQKVVLAFRGAVWSNMGSAIDDLEYFHTQFPEGITNSGVDITFLSYYLSLRRQIRDELTAIMFSYPKYKFWITGHSIGAAVAQIAALDLLDIVSSPIVYSFGTPRVGNYAFAKFYHSKVSQSVRVVHHKDIVAHVPFPSIGGKGNPESTSPYHAPQEIFYNEGMSSFKICNAEDGEDPKCSKSLGWFRTSVEDHRFYFDFEISNQCNISTDLPTSKSRTDVPFSKRTFRRGMKIGRQHATPCHERESPDTGKCPNCFLGVE